MTTANGNAPAAMLSDIDLERHRRMLDRYAEAQQLQARANELQAAFRVWCEELHDRYAIPLDGSAGVTEDGRIIRAPVASGP